MLVFSPTSKLSESLRAYVGVFTNMKSTEPLLVFSPTRKLMASFVDVITQKVLYKINNGATFSFER